MQLNLGENLQKTAINAVFLSSVFEKFSDFAGKIAIKYTVVVKITIKPA